MTIFAKIEHKNIQNMANNLMFEVGVKEAGNQLTELENRLKKIVSTYGKLELKVQVDGLKAFTSALENIGQSKGLEALQKRIDVLQVTLANVGMSGAKSIQEFEAAVKTTSAVADQYTQRINKMTEARDRLTKGTESWNRIDAQLTNFQNDKQVLAIYAQEQVAIKNLEDAKTRLNNTNTQEAESYQKVISSIETLSNAANTLKTVLGSWDPNKGSIVQLVEQFEKLHREIAAIASELKGIDPSKLNLSGLNINVGSIAGLGDLNSAIRELEVSINDIIRLFSNLANAVKLQPLDDQMKALLERCERAEAKLREVGEAARYLNEQNGARTHQKSQNIAGIAGLNEENVEKVSNLFERYRKLLADVQNQTANLGGIQNVAEKLGLNPTIVDQAAKRFEALWKTIENSMVGMERYKGFPVLDQSSDQLAKLRAEFSALLSEYKLVTQEANNYNKATERNAKAEQTRLEKAAAVQQKIDEMRQKTFSNLGIRENDPGMQNMQTALDNIMQKLTKAREDIDLYRAAIGQGSKESIDFGQKGLKEAEAQAETLMRQYAALYEAMERLRSGGNERPLLSTVQQNKELEMLNEAYRKGASELQKKAKAEDEAAKIAKKANEEAQKAAERSAKAQQRAQERIQNAAKRTSENLGTLTDRLDAKKLNFKGMDFTELDTAIGKIRAIKAELENFATTGRSSFGNTAKEIVQTMGLAQANEEARIAVGHLTTGKREAEKASKDLSDSEQRLANAIKSTSDSMRGQSQVLSDLKTMAMQYLSVWGAQSFVNSIIETGGLLEQQRLSLSAILGDMGKAQTLFNQIKGMALKSPFGVVELDKMSKQLAAYSFEYEELFDWTKRLADISAATGTSVDRLALALGHVRSEGALSGYTLRQFAMANVPVLRMLSENLGISSKEVRERVKKKEISAEDVQDILKQLTEDGGMFANAQETMSEALNAKFKNLRDAFDIMYGEIAESGIGDKLKDLAVMLTNGAKHWERLAKDVRDLAIAFGIGKVAMLMYNNALGKGTAVTYKSALASKQKEIANLKLTASYRALTTEEAFNIATAGKLNSRNIATLLSTKKLTVAELERLVALKKVDKEVALAAMRLQGLNTAQMQSVVVLGRWARMWEIVKYNIRLAGIAVKSFLAAAWPLLALTAVFELWNRRSEQRDNASDMAKTMAGNARGKEAYEMNSSLADSRKLSKEALQQNIEEMQNALQAANAYTVELKKQVDATDDLAKKYDILKGKIGEVADAYEEQKAAQEAMLEEAWNAGGGEWYDPTSYFRDNMLEDTQQFDTAMAEYNKKLTIASKQMKSVLSEWLKNQGQFNEEYAAMTGKQIFESIPEKLQKDFLYYASWNGNGMEQATREMLQGVSRAYNVVGSKLSEMRGEQGQEFASIMKAMYEEAFKVDLDKASNEQKIAFDKWLRETLARAEKLSSDAKEALRNIVIDFTIKLVPSYQVVKPKTPDEVINDELGSNQWLSNFFRRNNSGYGMFTEEATKALTDKYKKVLGDISLSNIDTAEDDINKKMDTLEKANKNLVKSIEKGNLSDAEKKKLEDTKKKNQEDYDLLNDALTDIGGTRKRKGDKSGKGSQEDKQAKELRERVRILKEAESAFQYWRKAVGDAASATHVNEEFGLILSEQGFSFENIKQYKNTLEELRAKYQGIYDASAKAGMKRPQLLEAIKEIDKVLADIGRKDFEKATEEFLSQTQIELDNLTRSWEMFNSVREATGNIDLAIQLSGADYSYGKTRNLADAIKEKIQDDFYAAGAVEIPFDINLSDKEIEEKIKKAMPKASETRIKGFVEEYKKWRDLQRDVLRNDIQTFSKILGSAVDYETQLRKINDELRKQIEANNKVAESNPAMQSEVDKANDIAYVQSVEKAWKATEAYAALYNSSLSMSRDELQNGINVATAILQEKMRLNLITAHEYAQEMEKIRKIMQDFDTNGLFGKDNGLTSYLKGGLQGLSVYYDRMIERYTRLGEQAKKDGRYEDWAQYMNTAANYEQAQKKLANFTSGIADATLVVDMAKGVLDGFQKAAQSLSNMFDALGKSGAAEQWSDIADTIGAITSTLNGGSSVLQNAMNGNIGGTISSILSAPVETITGPITAFAKLHDKKRERQIEDLKREVSKIDNTLNLIKSLRERELGYDSGNLRRQLAAQYEGQEKYLDTFLGKINLNKTATEMSEYYSRGGLEGSGYQQELNALKKQRELYQDMYEEEADKKKSSSEALEEYKQKMAELDMTIMNYAKDLANELWGIDLKGWADQIGDSLMTAFENGEDAAQAFKDTVQDIMRQVLRKMLNLGIIERMMGRLQTKLFGENGEGGSFDINNPEGTIDAAMRDVAEFFGENGDGQKMIEATQTFYNKWEEFMRSQGMTLSDEGSSSGTSSSIKSITEQTADLLASYLNATRASTSNIENLSAQYFPLFYTSITSGNASLVNIQQNTAAIMRSNEAIERSNQAILENINGLKNKTWRVPMA